MRRRTVLGSAIAGAFASVAAVVRPTTAQEATPSPFTGHPQVGVWMVNSPIGRAIAVYSADGSVVTALAASQAGPQGVAFSSTQIGAWESTGARGAHLTVVQLLSDEAGAYAGSVTVDAYQEVSEDGQTWMSGEGSSVTIRDAAHSVVQVIGDDGQVATAVRMTPGFAGFPEATPTAGTPAS